MSLKFFQIISLLIFVSFFLLCGATFVTGVAVADDVTSVLQSDSQSVEPVVEKKTSEESSSQTPIAQSPEENGASKKVERQKRKGKIPREKEAEGTQAPNRFGTDTIVKSKYEYNGQPLEVDTE